LVENRQFFPTPSHLTPSIGVTFFEFLEAVRNPGTKILHGAASEDVMVLA